MDNFIIGIIGMGDMGKLYARKLSSAGWTIHACDLPENFERLTAEFTDMPKVHILENGHLVSSSSDYILYNVEARNINTVVRQYAPSTKIHAIVGGQTSVKAPEIAAFSNHLAQENEMISIHSLHGPNTSPTSQPLVIIPHRTSPSSLEKVQNVLSCLQSNTIVLSAQEHDSITANTQALMSIIFLSLGKALQFQSQAQAEGQQYTVPPFENEIEKKAFKLVPRIYTQKWHVYAGLCILNPFSTPLLRTYILSLHVLNSLVKTRSRDEICALVRANARSVLNEKEIEIERACSVPRHMSHFQASVYIALFATLTTWSAMRINPSTHLSCSTPQYRQWLSCLSLLFSQPGFLEAVITRICEGRGEVDGFIDGVEGWAECVEEGNFEGFERRFEGTGRWFENWGKGA